MFLQVYLVHTQNLKKIHPYSFVQYHKILESPDRQVVKFLKAHQLRG